MRLTVNRDDLVAAVADKLKHPPRQVASIIQEYLQLVQDGVVRDNDDPTLFGIIPFDLLMKLYPGICTIYGHDSSGKTAVAMQIARSLHAHGLNVIYWDTDNKLYLHDLKHMHGIVVANARSHAGMKRLLQSDAVDVLIVDTLTSMEERTSLIRRVFEHVPYLVLITQMRNTWKKPEAEPACYETTLSSAHTHIHLTGREAVTVEGENMYRVQFRIDKYEPLPGLTGRRGSLIVKDGFVDNVYTAFDYLRTQGRISTIGRSKFLDDVDLGGKFKDVKHAVATLVTEAMWQDVMEEQEEPVDGMTEYYNDPGIL